MEIEHDWKGVKYLFKLFLDPGHGGKDPGAEGNGLEEKDITLEIAKQIQDILTNHYQNVSVKMSRTTDKFVSLEERTDAANSWGATFFFPFISIQEMERVLRAIFIQNQALLRQPTRKPSTRKW